MSQPLFEMIVWRRAHEFPARPEKQVWIGWASSQDTSLPGGPDIATCRAPGKGGCGTVPAANLNEPPSVLSGVFALGGQ